ncbi:nuclease [Methylophaga sp. 41_12_T18]|nr:nuclease [Methylophaga sp. 41_12_T18]
MRNGLLIGLLMQANLFAADIYRSQDDDGNVTFSDLATANSQPVISQVQPYRYLHSVAKVYDGDTIILENGERVRLLGINTPEIESRLRQGEQGGQQAKLWLQKKLQQGQVYLEYDQQRRDKYKRLLAHCFLADDEHLNLTIVAQGLATVTIIPPNLRYSEELTSAQQHAELAQLGIWSQAKTKPRPVEQLSKANSKGWQRYLATATSIKHGRSYVRLMLSKNVDLRIAKTNLHLFPELETYLNQALEVRGWASRSKQKFSILVHHPSAIIIR